MVINSRINFHKRLLSSSKRIAFPYEVRFLSDSEYLAEIRPLVLILKFSGAKVNFQSFTYIISSASG